MEFEWDSDKDKANVQKHGVSLSVGMAIFLDKNRLTYIDDRFDYQEIRYQTIGEIEGRAYVVIYTERGETTRLISVRKANEREQKRYGNSKTYL